MHNTLYTRATYLSGVTTVIGYVSNSSAVVVFKPMEFDVVTSILRSPSISEKKFTLSSVLLGSSPGSPLLFVLYACSIPCIHKHHV